MYVIVQMPITHSTNRHNNQNDQSIRISIGKNRNYIVTRERSNISSVENYQALCPKTTSSRYSNLKVQHVSSVKCQVFYCFQNQTKIHNLCSKKQLKQ